MTAFDLLDEKVRRWIWQQGWEGLKDVQERSIPGSRPVCWPGWRGLGGDRTKPFRGSGARLSV